MDHLTDYQKQTFKIYTTITNNVESILNYLNILTEIYNVYLISDHDTTSTHDSLVASITSYLKYKDNIKKELDYYHERWLNDIAEPDIIDIMIHQQTKLYSDLYPNGDIELLTTDDISSKLFNALVNITKQIMDNQIQGFTLVLKELDLDRIK